MKRKVIFEKIPGPFASLYEKASRLVKESYYRQVAEKTVSSLTKGIILDLGTGPGYLPVEIVRISPSVKVVGIDLSGKFINMAKDNALKVGVSDRLEFEIGNAAELRFNNSLFDMVISTGMLHMLRDPLRVFNECFRVLKKNGEAWILDPARVSSQIDRIAWKASLTFTERLLYRLFTLFSLINPSRSYNREQVAGMIALTDFAEYRIKEEDGEIEIRLKK